MPEAESIFSISKLTERISRLETDVVHIKASQPAQEGQIETLALEMQSLHEKVDQLDQKVDALDATFTRKFDGLEARVTRIEATMATKFELQQLRNWLEDQFADIKSFIANHTHS